MTSFGQTNRWLHFRVLDSVRPLAQAGGHAGLCVFTVIRVKFSGLECSICVTGGSLGLKFGDLRVDSATTSATSATNEEEQAN